MASCGIMRVEKCKRSDVYGLQIESNRTIEDHILGREFDKSDIDWNRTQDNIFLIKEDNWNKYITRYLKEHGLKERKDAVVMIDGLYTASREFFDNKTRKETIEYFKDCLRFHEKNYGVTFNAVIHFDESTPHLTVKSIPVIEDEKGLHLSAKIVMGNKDDYRLRQNQFYSEVSQKYGLERGELLEDAEIKHHLTVQEFKQVSIENEIINLSQQQLIEKERLNRIVQNINNLAVEAVKISGETQKNVLGKETGYVLYKKSFARKLETAAAQLKKISGMLERYNRVIIQRDKIINKAKEEAKKIRNEELELRAKRIRNEQELSILKEFLKKHGFNIEQIIKLGFEKMSMKMKNKIN